MSLRLAQIISTVINPIVLISFVPYILVYKSLNSVSSAIYWTGFSFNFIIVFSVFADDQAIQGAYGYGANLYVVKPEEYGLLKSALHTILSMDWSDPKSITEKFFSKERYIPFTNAG